MPSVYTEYISLVPVTKVNDILLLLEAINKFLNSMEEVYSKCFTDYVCHKRYVILAVSLLNSIISLVI